MRRRITRQRGLPSPRGLRERKDGFAALGAIVARARRPRQGHQAFGWTTTCGHGKKKGLVTL
jgi:hypothetical protein